MGYYLYRDDGVNGLPTIEINKSNDPAVRNIPTLHSVDLELTEADLGKKFTFKIFAHNREGSISSKHISYLFATEPETPSLAPVVIAKSTTECYVEYLFIDSIAGSEIISFHLQARDNIDNRWSDLMGMDDYESLATLHRFKVVKGAYYELRFRVKNTVGWSGFSPTSSFIASEVPSEPSAPELVSFSASAISLKFDPSKIDDGGVPLLSYVLEVNNGFLNVFTKLSSFTG